MSISFKLIQSKGLVSGCSQSSSKYQVLASLHRVCISNDLGIFLRRIFGCVKSQTMFLVGFVASLSNPILSASSKSTWSPSMLYRISRMSIEISMQFSFD